MSEGVGLEKASAPGREDKSGEGFMADGST